jgi:hypothetical protein
MTHKSQSAVTHVMEPWVPGTYGVLTVGGATDDTGLWAFPLATGPTEKPDRRTQRLLGTGIPLTIIQRTEEVLTVDIPGDLRGVSALLTSAHFDPKRAWIVNRPQINWAYPASAKPGGELRLMGRNLARFDWYPTINPKHPVSFGGLLEFDDLQSTAAGTRGWIRRRGESSGLPIGPIKASAYEARVLLPAILTPGAYEVFLHNGWGGMDGWSEPFFVDIEACSSWPSTGYEVDAYVAKTGNEATGIAHALADLQKNGGGILRFGPRTYHLTETLVIPPRTVVRGAGADRTLLDLPFDHTSGAQPPFVAITGDGDFAVEDLYIRGTYAPLLICAPSFNPQTQDEAARESDAQLGLSERRAHNVAVRRCRLEQLPFRQSMRRPKDFDSRGWMKAFGGKGWAGIGADQYAAVFFKGDGLEVADSHIIGGGHAVNMNRSTSVRITGNTLRAGCAGMAVHGYSRLTWPADGSGAKIEGCAMARVIVEDNDISAVSEFARNLVSFNFGGDDLHIVRNRIQGILPNCDSEALMTHLWQARWVEPRIRMTGPTTGEILDPGGEVSRENLEGAWLEVMEGRGLAQLRRVVKRDGNQFKIDRPWDCEPDEHSRIAFTAPAPFRNLTLVDNTVISEAVNIIVWGTSYDTVVDGNMTADGPGITIWSVRLAPDQKVWGGAIFTTVINNVVDRGFGSSVPANGGPLGIFNLICFDYSGAPIGYDYLGYVVRNNHAMNNTGIGFQASFSRGANRGRETDTATRVREAGVVIEKNHCSRSGVGIVLEKGTRLVERDNTSDQVEYPLTWVDAS